MFLIGVLCPEKFLIGDRFLCNIGEVGSSLAFGVEVSWALGAGPLPVGFYLIKRSVTDCPIGNGGNHVIGRTFCGEMILKIVV